VKKLRVLALVEEALMPPDRAKESERATAPWRTEYDVISTLRSLGHQVHPLGVGGDLGRGPTPRAPRGYDETFGARPMGRLIQEQIKRVLADEMLFGQLREGGPTEIDAGEDGLRFAYTPLRQPAPTA
jgi:hypothetical protein